MVTSMMVTQAAADLSARGQGGGGMEPAGSRHMRSGFLASALAFALIGAAHAACDRPAAPSCAIAKIPFPNDAAADDCRKDMLRFRDSMEAFAACVGQTSADEKKVAYEDYEK